MKLTREDLNTIIKESVTRLMESYAQNNNEEHPSIYVGTYGKYNSGSLNGEWVRLDDFSSKNEFLRYCVNKLHADERDPELMFQDYEYIPEGFVGESFISDKLWDLMKLDGNWDLKVAVANAIGDPDETIELLESGDYRIFWGCDSIEDVVYEYLDEGIMPARPEYYFDYEAFGRDNSYDGPFNEENETIYDEFGVEEGDDYALGEAIINKLYGGIENTPPDTIKQYIDVSALARDMNIEGTFVGFDGGMIEIFQ